MELRGHIFQCRGPKIEDYTRQLKAIYVETNTDLVCSQTAMEILVNLKPNALNKKDTSIGTDLLITY